MTDILELAANVEALDGPDREVDLSIMRYVCNIGGPASNALRYTESLDAAMTLTAAEVAKAAMAAAFRNVGFSEDIITAGFGECCGAWDDDQCKEFLPEIFKAMCAAKADELEKQNG